MGFQPMIPAKRTPHSRNGQDARSIFLVNPLWKNRSRILQYAIKRAMLRKTQAIKHPQGISIFIK